MPRVKFDYIVSFSSEDPENQASNLLASNVSTKKWLCNKGEPSCSVVLQLAKAVQICTVHIGAHNSALVEVLVGRSEKPNDPFQVLVPSSVLQSPSEARRAEGAARVRSFTGAALAATAVQRWDRVRVVCSQPYNKHCKYGLSFVHIHSPEETAPAPTPTPAPATYSSDEETEFRPGELFAAHVQSTSATTDTGAQIRQATSQVLKNIPDSSIKLVKTPITKLKKQPMSDGEHTCRDTTNDQYKNTTEIDKNNRKVDDRNESKNDDRRKADDRNASRKDDGQKFDHRNASRKDDRQKANDSNASRKDGRQKADDLNVSRKDDRQKVDNRNSSRKDDKEKGDEHKPSRGGQDEGGRQKRRHSGNTGSNDVPELRPGPVSSAPHSLLRDAVVVLSGYQNPRRATLRAAATALGAACSPHYSPRCTHLLCAFPNTPKLRQVRSSPGGERVVVVRGEWVEQMARQRRLLPWQWFATEPHRRVAPPAGALHEGPQQDASTDEYDTDDEIEKVRQKMKKQRTDRSPSHTSPVSTSSRVSPTPSATSRVSPTPGTSSRVSPTPGTSSRVSPTPEVMSDGSDVEFVRDERMQGAVSVSESEWERASTEGSRAGSPPLEEIDPSAALPDMFRGRTFRLGGPRPALLRYLRAYSGTTLQDASEQADYLVGGDGVTSHGTHHVTVGWVWRCHRARRLLPPDVTPAAP